MNPLNSDNLAAKRLRACRLGARETLAQVGALAGVHKSTVLRWERGDTSKINRPTLHLLAAHFGVEPAWLLGQEEPEPAVAESRPRLVPILGTVRGGAGRPGRGGNSWLRTGRRLPFWERGGFFLAAGCRGQHGPRPVRGRSGADPPAGSGGQRRYAVALVDGEEGLVKQVFHGPGWLELRSVNPYYPPRRFEGEALERVRILGQVAESRRRYL